MPTLTHSDKEVEKEFWMTGLRIIDEKMEGNIVVSYGLVIEMKKGND